MTQSQWYEKLNKFLPRWFFEVEQYNVAHLKAIALLLSTLDEESQAHYQQTFVGQADSEFLELHGSERSETRRALETVSQFRGRVQNLANKSNRESMKRIVDSLLSNGESTILEDSISGLFFNRDSFFNQDAVYVTPTHNAFTVVIPIQGEHPEGMTSEDVLDLIVETINDTKALGTLYRVVEI